MWLQKGRSFTDMIFIVRQIVEKSWEHKAKLFLTFIDLKKAYDSVPRNALWIALRKMGVLYCIVQLVQSFHHGKQAQICLEGKLLEEIDVDNGLRQGCCMASVLFNLYTWSVALAEWRGYLVLALTSSTMGRCSGDTPAMPWRES